MGQKIYNQQNSRDEIILDSEKCRNYFSPYLIFSAGLKVALFTGLTAAGLYLSFIPLFEEQSRWEERAFLEKMSNSFRKFDFNDDGVIERSELEKAMQMMDEQ